MRPRAIHGLAAVLLAVAVLSITACAGRPATPEAAPQSLILISLDGFRWDFRERADSPHLDQLAATGVTAKRMIASFPTKTFPNHYTIVTGLYPGHHGVVANNMYDPVFDETYGLRKREEVANGRWYGGEPLWVTAEKAGMLTAPYFWPGSEAEIGGFRPTYWAPYDHDLPNEDRVDRVLDRLALPVAERPRFATLYFSTMDDAAHAHDPDTAPEIAEAVRVLDALVGRLLAGLDRLGLTESTNVVVVSDHGMAALSEERVILVDDYVDLGRANVVDWNPVMALWPEQGDVDAIYAALEDAHPHLQVYRKAEIPERFHYRDHRRVAPIIGVADEGWSIMSRRYFDRARGNFPGGTHGYDPELLSQGALFIASGPAFRRGLVVEPFENVHLYPLMAEILGLEPAPSDGDLGAVRHFLID